MNSIPPPVKFVIASKKKKTAFKSDFMPIFSSPPLSSKTEQKGNKRELSIGGKGRASWASNGSLTWSLTRSLMGQGRGEGVGE